MSREWEWGEDSFSPERMGTEEINRKDSLAERDNKKEIQYCYSKPSILKFGRGKKKANVSETVSWERWCNYKFEYC